MITSNRIGGCAALVVVLAVSAGACGVSSGKQRATSPTTSTGTHSASASTPVHGTVSTAVLAKAIAATKSVATGHFSVEFDGSADTGTGTGTMKSDDPSFMREHSKPGSTDDGTKGVFDRANGRAIVDIAGFGMKSVVVDGGHDYVNLKNPKNKAMPWQELSAKQFKSVTALAVGDINPTDPMDMLQDVKFVGPTATVVGSGRFDGTPVVQYQAHMNLNALNAARQIPDSSSGITVLKIQSPAADDIPVDLWVDSSGRVRRIWYAASYAQTETYRFPSGSGQTKTSTSTSHNDIGFDLSTTQVGEPVSIPVPPPSQVAPPTSGGISGLPGS